MKKRFFLKIPLFFLLAFHFTSFSQPFSLLRDIHEGNTYTKPFGPRDVVDVNGVTFFTAFEPGFGVGRGLWKSDGTAAGTVKVKGGFASIQFLVNVNGIVLFTAADNVLPFDVVLWRSDGTEAGTIVVKNISVKNVTRINNTLFFTGNDGITGEELWKSDGTDAGTIKVKDINVETNVGGPTNLTNVNGTLFFSALTGPSPYISGLWKSDGTEAGTVLVKNGISLSNTFNANGTFYFIGNNGINGSELWKSDGTETGTVMVKDIEVGGGESNINGFNSANGLLYFFAVTSLNGIALWKSDGTGAGTELVKDLSDNYSPGNLTDVNGVLFFSGYDEINGAELWKSDGTNAGTVMAKNINPGVDGSNPSNLVNVNGVLFFSAFEVLHGYELWKSDGTTTGTVLVKDIYLGTGSSAPLTTDIPAFSPPAGPGFAVVNNLLFFSATNGINGRELWKTDGTANGTVLLRDIYSPTGSANPRKFTYLNGAVYFTAGEGFRSPFLNYVSELYKTDGTLSGTTNVRVIFGLGGSFPNHLTSFNNSIYFSATDGVGPELYKSDGTFAGTVKVKDINPTNGPTGSNPANFTPVNNQLFFSATEGTNGNELWKTDGTEAGTVLVKNINPAANNSDPSNLLQLNDILYFTADNGADGRELWKSDGTDAGTLMVKNINPGSSSSNPSHLTRVNGVLYFTANNGTNGIELWKSDGTNAGTIMVRDINAGPASGNPGFLTDINGMLYFAANDGTGGMELWKSDGTTAGTLLVKDINAGPAGSEPSSFINISGIAYFSADNGSVGRELWKTNGTDAGTVLVKDINPAGNSNPSVFTKVGNNLLFAADDGTHGNEIWISNGAEAGTKLMQDIEPGNVGSDPVEIIELPGKVLTSVTTSLFGSEIWVAPAPADSPLPLELLEFKGTIVNTDGLLHWKTDNETNTASFIIERSIDGRTYQSIGSVAAANSPGIHHYDFTDVNITSLGITNFYYRLKQTDLDGKYVYSNIVVLSVSSGTNFVLLYPNPAIDRINMTIHVSQKEKMQWQLMDNMGRRIKAGSYDLSPGSLATSIDIATLSAGVYLIQLNSSSLQKVIKVVKQ